MENFRFTSFFRLLWQPLLLRGLFLFVICILSGCASSNVSREATSNIDQGVQNAQNMFGSPSNTDIAESYQNTSQETKGGLMGGAVGAVTGAVSSSIGFLPGTAVGAILGASYGSYIDANTTIEDKLQNRGINMIVLGDQILMVLPSDQVFNAMSAEIKPQAYSTLELVVQYINSYTKTLVKVAAYTSSLGSERVNLSLSQQQANSVKKFLVESGIDARLLYAIGYGGTHLIEKESLLWNRTDNYRVEITLEKLHV